MPKVKKTQRQPTSQQLINSLDPADLQTLLRIRNDPLAFCKLVGFQPHKAQEIVMRSDLHERYTMLPWARGDGKSYGLRYKIAWDCFRLPDFHVYLWSPSEQQSRRIYQGIVEVCKKCELLQFDDTGRRITFGHDGWGSFFELLLVGQDAGKARGPHIGRGYLVAEEIDAHANPELICDTVEPSIVTGGGLVYLSSPGDALPSNYYYRTYRDWSNEQKRGNEKYQVIRCKWRDCGFKKREEVLRQYRRHKAKGTLWIFKREYLGRFTVPSGQFFNATDVYACQLPQLDGGSRGDIWIYSCDFGMSKSPCILLISRFNQLLRRLEIVEMFSLIREDNKYVSTDGGHIVVGGYLDILDLILDQRKHRPICKFYYDPGIEVTAAEILQNTHQVPIVPCRIGGYNAKLTALMDLQRSLANQRIVWTDPRITQQLLEWSPRKNANTGKYDFDAAGPADIIVTLCQLSRYLGDRSEVPFYVTKHERKVAI